jgi:ankyrin repeat protein
VRAGAPLDHVNNLHWTAAIEAVVLGDGGPRHQATLKTLVDAGANLQLKDRTGNTPLQLARSRGYTEMVKLLEKMLAGIVGFELRVTALQCKVKLNQHRRESHAAMHAVYSAGTPDEQALARWMDRLGMPAAEPSTQGG